MAIDARPTTEGILLPSDNQNFLDGYRLGRIWALYGEPEETIDSTYLLENLKGFAARDLYNGEHDDWLNWHIGFLVGMMSGGVFPASESEPE